MLRIRSVSHLREYYEKNFKDISMGKVKSKETVSLSVAAGHALDLIDAAKDSGVVELDLSIESISSIYLALYEYSKTSIKKFNDRNEFISDLIKKAASYEMFSLCKNFYRGEIVFTMEPTNNNFELVLKGVNNKTSVERRINLYDAYRKDLDNIFEFREENGETTLYISQYLETEIMYEEFLKYFE